MMTTKKIRRHYFCKITFKIRQKSWFIFWASYAGIPCKKKKKKVVNKL